MTKAKAKIGDHVEVYWLDARGVINDNFSKAVPAKAISRGVLRRNEEDYLVLEHGIYPDEKDTPVDDPCGDWTVLPTAWATEIKVIKAGK